MTFLPRSFVGVLVAGLLAGSVVACGQKKETTAAPVVTNQTASAANAEQAAAVAAQVAPTPGAPTVNDQAELNRELRKWILRNRRPPRDFEDFASTAGIQIAPAPDGKKYAIDKTMHVVLVKR